MPIEEYEEGINNKDISIVIPRGGAIIDGTTYKEHPLERMAPDVPEFRKEITKRVGERAERDGHIRDSDSYNTYIKKYVNLRNLSPRMVKDMLKNIKGIAGK